MGLEFLRESCLKNIAVYFPFLTDMEEVMGLDGEEFRSVLECKHLHVPSEDKLLEVRSG